MPRLIAVDVTLDFPLATTVEVSFSTSRALLTAVDTAVLLIVDRSGSEFGIRLERGHVTDAYLWDAGRVLRQGLPVRDVSISDGLIRCPIPVQVLPTLTTAAGLTAALIVNGALVQSGFAVTTSTSPRADVRAGFYDHAKEGQHHG